MMLYCEFLEETGAPENAYSWAEYQRIEKIYNADNTMEKRDAYALYQKPDALTQTLMKEISVLRDQNRRLRKEKAELSAQIEEMNIIMKHDDEMLRNIGRRIRDLYDEIDDEIELEEEMNW